MADVDDFLAHYGVKGMKWGVKKGIVSPRTARTKKETKVREKRKESLRRRQVLSDKDLDQLVNRLQKEKKLKELLDGDLRPGRTASKRLIATAGGVVLGGVVAGGMKAGLRAILTKELSPTQIANFVVPLPKKK